MAGPKVILLILAAGEGRRYQGIKQLAPIDGVPMVYHTIQSLYAPELYKTTVVLGAYYDEVCSYIPDFEIDIIRNDDWKEGMASSIRHGVKYVIETYPEANGIIIALADQWKLESSHLGALVGHGERIVASAYQEGPGVPAYFPRKYWNGLLKLSGDEGAKEYLRSLEDVALVDIPEALEDMDQN